MLHMLNRPCGLDNGGNFGNYRNHNRGVHRMGAETERSECTFLFLSAPNLACTSALFEMNGLGWVLSGPPETAGRSAHRNSNGRMQRARTSEPACMLRSAGDRSSFECSELRGLLGWMAGLSVTSAAGRAAGSPTAWRTGTRKGGLDGRRAVLLAAWTGGWLAGQVAGGLAAWLGG